MQISTWDDLNAVAQIAFNVVAMVAIAAAAVKYVFLSGGPRRHTELAINAVPVHRQEASTLFEVQLRIDNRGIELLEIYNVFLRGRSTLGDPDWKLSLANLVTETDEKIWLHSNTGISINVLVTIPSTVKVATLELIVPYVQKRLPGPVSPVQAAQNSIGYNSLERTFALTA
jgi:hypothetical protein